MRYYIEELTPIYGDLGTTISDYYEFNIAEDGVSYFDIDNTSRTKYDTLIFIGISPFRGFTITTSEITE